MTKKTRTILFLIFLFLFLLVAPISIFYSQGYRFDFESKKITQTGGIFLKAEPKQVEIYINGKLAKKTDFFFGSALIENLLPNKYKIEIKKEGYHSWGKKLEIKEKEVSEVKNIVLFPKNPNFSILTKTPLRGTRNFWFSPDGKKMILKEEEENWALKLYDLDRSVKSHLIEGTDLSTPHQRAGGGESELFDLKFSEDSKKIFLEAGIGEQLKYFTLEIEKTPPLLLEIKEQLPPIENILTYQNFNGDIYFLDNFGELWRSDSSFSIKEKITETPFPAKAETEHDLYIFPGFFFLREGETLYLFNPDSKLFEKFFEKIDGLKISPDNKKLLFFSDSEIWVLFLKEKLTQNPKKAGEKILLVRLSEKIESAFWLNSDYLIFNAGDKIKIAEIDERDKLNIVDLIEFKNPKIFFNQTDKKLYVLADGILYSSESLLK